MQPNTLPRIDHIWLFVSVDEQGNEGVIAGDLGPPYGFMPLIAADEERLKSLMPLAKAVARDTGMKVRLVKFRVRELVEEIDGD